MLYARPVWLVQGQLPGCHAVLSFIVPWPGEEGYLEIQSPGHFRHSGVLGSLGTISATEMLQMVL